MRIIYYLMLFSSCVYGYLDRLPHLPKTFFPFEIQDLEKSSCFINKIQINTEQLNAFIEMKEKEIGKAVVLKVSSLLPNFDSVGHKVLHANNEFISWMLNSHQNIPDEIKKEIILLSIRFAQHGDNFGSTLLQMYYDIVDKSL